MLILAILLVTIGATFSVELRRDDQVKTDLILFESFEIKKYLFWDLVPSARTLACTTTDT